MILYKYVVPDRIDILERGYVRFTHPRALNDLSELRPAFNRLLTREETQQYLRGNPLDKTDIARRASGRAYEESPAAVQQLFGREGFHRFTVEALRSKEGAEAEVMFQGLALAMMNSMTPNVRSLTHTMYDEQIGVFSLSATSTNGPMWAHYAADHTGFAIGFDSTNQFFNRRRSKHDEFYHLRRVRYAQLRAPRSFSDLGEAEALFLTKHPDWSYEREWRMLVPLADADLTVGTAADPVHLFSVPAAAISKVIVGARASLDLRQKIEAMLASEHLPHVELSEVAVDDELGGLQLARLA